MDLKRNTSISMSNSAGVVASGCGYTAKAAIFALEKGGNAVDAAIAAQLAAVGKNLDFKRYMNNILILFKQLDKI